MSSSSDHHDPRVRRVVLPSGKTIEVVFFADVPEAVELGAVTGELHACPACRSELVYPVSWEEAGLEHWQVSLRCPNCELRRTCVSTQGPVERFDARLDRATEAMIGDLRRLTQENMEAEIVRFAGALEADVIIPEDF